MEDVSISKEYTLSERTMERLRVIKETLKENISRADPRWKIIAGKEEECVDSEESTDDYEEDPDNSVSHILDHVEVPSTQFYFTQVERKLPKESTQASIQKFDIVECLYEGLERTNGKLELSQLESLSDEELLEVVYNLKERLSAMGVYNLCRSMNSMSLEQRLRYAAVLHSHLLLPKIIDLEEPSRLLSSAIAECVQKFPDDIQKLIFIPLLNVDLKDTTIANVIVNAFEPERNAILIEELVGSVKELKLWHIPILQNLLLVRMDRSTNDKLIRLFSEKALDFAKDKSFGKLVLSFIKANVDISEESKSLLQEIADINQTLFKRPIENVLKNI